MDKLRKLAKNLEGYRYVLLAALAGLLILLWPTGRGAPSAESGGADTEEARLEAILTQIEGVGQSRVLLSENGAVVVCPGADSPSVCLRVTQAVRCYTGLGADAVKVFKTDHYGRDES